MSYKTVRDNVADRIDREMIENVGMFDMTTWGRGCNTASCLAGHAAPNERGLDVAPAGAKNLGLPIEHCNEDGHFLDTEHPFFTHPIPAELTAWLRGLPDRELTATEIKEATKKLDSPLVDLLDNLNNQTLDRYDLLLYTSQSDLVKSVTPESVNLLCGGEIYYYTGSWQVG